MERAFNFYEKNSIILILLILIISHDCNKSNDEQKEKKSVPIDNLITTRILSCGSENPDNKSGLGRVGAAISFGSSFSKVAGAIYDFFKFIHMLLTHYFICNKISIKGISIIFILILLSSLSVVAQEKSMKFSLSEKGTLKFNIKVSLEDESFSGNFIFDNNAYIPIFNQAIIPQLIKNKIKPISLPIFSPFGTIKSKTYFGLFRFENEIGTFEYPAINSIDSQSFKLGLIENIIGIGGNNMLKGKITCFNFRDSTIKFLDTASLTQLVDKKHLAIYPSKFSKINNYNSALTIKLVDKSNSIDYLLDFGATGGLYIHEKIENKLITDTIGLQKKKSGFITISGYSDTIDAVYYKNKLIKLAGNDILIPVSISKVDYFKKNPTLGMKFISKHDLFIIDNISNRILFSKPNNTE